MPKPTYLTEFVKALFAMNDRGDSKSSSVDIWKQWTKRRREPVAERKCARRSFRMALEIDGSPGASWTARTTRRASSRRRRKSKAARLSPSSSPPLVKRTMESSGFATRALSSSDAFRSAGLANAARRKRRCFGRGSFLGRDSFPATSRFTPARMRSVPRRASEGWQPARATRHVDEIAAADWRTAASPRIASSLRESFLTFLTMSTSPALSSSSLW
mmetsp:Transcript_17978/g.62216  ORF Transcript_17978/g.62216 Transcript_17978/m.62216 type:complete len:217 (-) Transcript_17978:211-861(-)